MITGQNLQALIVELSQRMSTIERSHAENLSPALAPAEMSALRFLSRNARSRMKELAHGIGIAPSSATNLVDKLFHRGLVDRDRPADNRRVVTLILTSKARRIISAIEAEQLALCDTLVRDLAQDDADLIRRLLGQLTNDASH